MILHLVISSFLCSTRSSFKKHHLVLPVQFVPCSPHHNNLSCSDMFAVLLKALNKEVENSRKKLRLLDCCRGISFLIIFTGEILVPGSYCEIYKWTLKILPEASWPAVPNCVPLLSGCLTSAVRWSLNKFKYMWQHYFQRGIQEEAGTSGRGITTPLWCLHLDWWINMALSDNSCHSIQVERRFLSFHSSFYSQFL